MPPKNKGQKAAAAADADDHPPVSQAKTTKRGRASLTQEVMEDAAADAAAEAGMMNQETESEVDGGAPAGAKKQQILPAGLLERRLEKAITEKSEMEIKIAELEKKLAEKDASEVSPRPCTGAKAAAKVEHRLVL